MRGEFKKYLEKLTGSPTGVLGLYAFAFLLLLVILAPLFFVNGATEFNLDEAMQGSSAAHWLGTDELGRDILSRVMTASRLSFGVSIAATLLGAAMGITLGMLPVITGKRVGRFINAFINFALAFPALLLSLFVAAVVGAGLQSALLAIAFALAPIFARLAQTLMSSVRNADYVSAARLLGASHASILFRHILPNIAGPLMVTWVMSVSSALIVLSSLSFLGLGVQAPYYDWGVLLNQGLNRVYVDPAPALAPAAAIVFSGLALSFIGEALAMALGLRTVSRGALKQANTSIETLAETDDLLTSPALALEVEKLNVDVGDRRGEPLRILHGISLALKRGERVAIVGESGSGKTMAALAVAQLLDSRVQVSARKLLFVGNILTGAGALPKKEKDQLLGSSLAMIFQDPLTSFNPVLRMGGQLAEPGFVHGGLTRNEALARATDRLREVGINAAEKRVRQYPHEFSGGMLQRSMIGMGLMLKPGLVVADEPTTALDVTVQKNVLALLDKICRENDSALLLISHDLAVVSNSCERILVMYAGRIVEDLTVKQLLDGPAHPYTKALLSCSLDMNSDTTAPLPSLAGRAPAPGEIEAGCAFAPRCDKATAQCRETSPLLERVAEHHFAACWRPDAQREPA